MPRKGKIAMVRDLDAYRTLLRQPVHEPLNKATGHVLHDQHWNREVFGKAGEDGL